MNIRPPVNNRYEYPIYNKNTQQSGKRIYITPGGPLPSVTTILSATQDNTFLDKWRKRIGIKEAARITKEASTAGSLMHESIEDFLNDRPRKNGSNYIYKLSRLMADNIINNGLCNVDEIWGIEIPLYFPNMYAGTTDLIGLYNNKPSIMDHKNSKKIKKREYVEDYFMQGALYAEAHNNLYGTDIRQVVLFMASRDLNYKTFVIKDSEFDSYVIKAFERVVQYYELLK